MPRGSFYFFHITETKAKILNCFLTNQSTYVLNPDVRRFERVNIVALMVMKPHGRQETGSSPGSGRSLETAWPPVFICWRNSMDKETWWGTVCGVRKESDMTE